MNETEGSSGVRDEQISEPEPQNQELDNNAAKTAGDARSSTKIENMIRDDRYYEIPAEFPYLMHATRIENIEGVMWTGLQPFAGQHGEDETLDYVDRKVVCAVAPKKIKDRNTGEVEVFFPDSAYTSGKQIRLTFELTPGEKVMMWDVSGDHPRECRVDREIKPEQIHSIQDMGAWKKNYDGSLWGFFVQNIYELRITDGYEMEQLFDMADSYPEICAWNGLSQIEPFLAQYGLTGDLGETTTSLVSELDNLCRTQFLALSNLRSKWVQQNDESDFHHLSRVLKVYLAENSEPHERAVAIASELKTIFTDTIQNELGIDSIDKNSFDSYLNNLREKYELSNEQYRIRPASVGDYSERSPWYGNSFEVNEKNARAN